MEHKRTSLTIAQVNLLLLICMVLILGGSIAMQGLSTTWVLLAREVLFVLAPALVALLVLRLAARETLRAREVLRVRWPGWRVALMCTLIGLGGWLIDVWLGAVLVELLGYTVPLPPDFYPTTAGQALATLVVLAVVAPICEEVLFRGVIQRGYEQLGAWPSILIGGVLFIIFHQSLPQGLALMPLAFLLGYLTWRTDSLLSSIVVHVVNNTLAALMIILAAFALRIGASVDQATMPEINVALCSLPAALVGLALVFVGLRGIQRWAPQPPPIPRVTLRPGFLPWLARIWPILLILPLYLIAISAEAVIGRAPELLAFGRPVRWSAAPWDSPHTWTYEIQASPGTATLSEPLGQARCSLTPQGDTFALACERKQTIYEPDSDQGPHRRGDVKEHLEARWRASDLRLLSAERTTQIKTPEGDTVTIESLTVPDGDAVEVTVRQAGGAPETVHLDVGQPASSLLPGPVPVGAPTVLESAEWPWRFSALPFEGVYSAQAALVYPYNLEGASEEGSSPQIELTSVVVASAEPIRTPAGATIAWRVQVGDDWVAWYDSEAPYNLVALDNGVERWVLTSAE
jgi:membrane protease YdiL (CAAX protease family)